jgi:hypothetical protein
LDGGGSRRVTSQPFQTAGTACSMSDAPGLLVRI